jgi:hypothetical protein
MAQVPSLPSHLVLGTGAQNLGLFTKNRGKTREKPWKMVINDEK